MDVPEPPRVVLEQPAPCADTARAEELLRRALAPAVAPHGGWTVTMRVAKEGPTLHAEAEITDESEAPVAHRAVEERATACAAMARAVGVWASLVLDQEVQRAQAEADKTPPAPEPQASVWPSPVVDEKPAPDAHLFLKDPEDKRILEIGVGWWIMEGTGGGVVTGPALFAVVEVGDGWFLQPQISWGFTTQSLSSTSDLHAMWGATRFDACKRLPGNYLERRGMQLDLCGGAELGFLHLDAPPPPATVPDLPTGSDMTSSDTTSGARTLPFVAVGPSIGLRGELGSALSVVFRGVAEINLLRESLVDARFALEPSLFVGRAEVGMTWRLR